MTKPRRATDAELLEALEGVLARTDRRARRAVDPVSLVHDARHPLDRELVGLVAASLAFGKATTAIAKTREVFALLGAPPRVAADDPPAVRAALQGWVHRLYRGNHVAALLIGARSLQKEDGSLGARFRRDWSRRGDLRGALSDFVHALRKQGGFNDLPPSAGATHLLPDPARGSSCKRLLLFLRWMIRPADGIDLGLWNGIPSRALVIPVDTHIHKLANNLGLSRRRSADFVTAQEITAALARLDPEDPVRFDFALCHLGMATRCRSRRDSACEGCGVRSVCIHWR